MIKCIFCFPQQIHKYNKYFATGGVDLIFGLYYSEIKRIRHPHRLRIFPTAQTAIPNAQHWEPNFWFGLRHHFALFHSNPNSIDNAAIHYRCPKQLLSLIQSHTQYILYRLHVAGCVKSCVCQIWQRNRKRFCH